MARSGVNMNAYITYRGYNDNGVGQYDVSLWNGRQWVAVRVQFDGRTDETDVRPTADYASWAIIMNRAWERFHGNTGASPADCLYALGRNSSTIFQNQMTTATFDAIQSYLAAGRVVAAGTVGSPSASNLVDNHAYTVVQVGWINGVRYVQLRNPWGVDGARSSDANSRDGLVWITWNQFVAKMSAVIVS